MNVDKQVSRKGFLNEFFPETFSDYQSIPHEKQKGHNWRIVQIHDNEYHCHNQTHKLFKKANPYVEVGKILGIYNLGFLIFGVLFMKDLFLALKETKAVYADFKAAEGPLEEIKEQLRNSPTRLKREAKRVVHLDESSEHFKGIENFTCFDFLCNNSEKFLPKFEQALKNLGIFYALYADGPSIGGISTVWAVRTIGLIYFLTEPLSARVWLSDFGGQKDRIHGLLLEKLGWNVIDTNQEEIREELNPDDFDLIQIVEPSPFERNLKNQKTPKVDLVSKLEQVD